MSKLLNQTQLSAALSVAKSTISEWQRVGKITPEVCEGRVIKYDLEKVRQELRESSLKQTEDRRRRFNTANS